MMLDPSDEGARNIRNVCQDVGVRRFYEEVGRRLRQARTDADLTQQQLADKVGVSRASVANIEAGRQPFLLHVLNGFAAALEVKPCTLLPDEGARAAELDLPVEKELEDLSEAEQRWVRRVLTPAGQR